MSELSEKIYEVSVTYLGPAARKFLERQTNAHMGGVTFDHIEHEHLEELVKWIGISAKLYIDKDKAKEMTEKIASL